MKEGDIVKLKSSSCDMTVERVNSWDFRDEDLIVYVDCVWFDGSILKRDKFNKNNLMLIESDDSKNKR